MIFNIPGSARARRRALTSILALVGFATAAHAADWPLKAPPPLPDITWNGITFIGNIDVSGQYESKGAPYVGQTYSTSGLITPWNRSPQWLLAPNQEAQSFVGLKVDKEVYEDLRFIARLEAGFNPTTGDIADTLKVTQKMDGIPLNQQAMNGDGSRAGQILNGEAWAGFDSSKFGALHVGRNNTVSIDMMGAYDPLSSLGFSLFGYVGTLAGQGSPETSRIDSSVKYLKEFGPFRIEALYGQPGTNVNQFFQGTAGVVFPNFSFDFIGGQAKDVVLASALSGTANLGSSFLGARVFDTTMLGFFGKYVFDVGRKGDFTSKLTLSGGYQRIDFSNPSDGGFSPGHTIIGGYEIGPAFSTNGSPAGGVVNYAFTGGDKILGISFVAAKYQYDPQWTFALAYYRYDQNSYGFGVNSVPGILASSYSNTKCSSSSFTNCTGNEQVISFRADYQWNKNLSFYAGIAYSQVAGGFAFGYLATSTFDPTVGMRFAW
jgi:predicted porin